MNAEEIWLRRDYLVEKILGDDEHYESMYYHPAWPEVERLSIMAERLEECTCDMYFAGGDIHDRLCASCMVYMNTEDIPF